MPRTRLKIDVSFNEEANRRDPIEIEVPGLGVFELPGNMNALATVRVARWHESGVTELTTMQCIALLGDLIPDEVLRLWHAQGFDILDEANAPLVEAIVVNVVEEYQERANAAGTNDPGKARRPEQQHLPPPYSGTGPSSEPISDGSTASPFPVI